MLTEVLGSASRRRRRQGAEHGLGAAAAAAGEGKRLAGKEFICGALVFRVWRCGCLHCDPCYGRDAGEVVAIGIGMVDLVYHVDM